MVGEEGIGHAFAFANAPLDPGSLPSQLRHPIPTSTKKVPIKPEGLLCTFLVAMCEEVRNNVTGYAYEL